MHYRLRVNKIVMLLPGEGLNEAYPHPLPLPTLIFNMIKCAWHFLLSPILSTMWVSLWLHAKTTNLWPLFLQYNILQSNHCWATRQQIYVNFFFLLTKRQIHINKSYKQTFPFPDSQPPFETFTNDFCFGTLPYSYNDIPVTQGFLKWLQISQMQ